MRYYGCKEKLLPSLKKAVNRTELYEGAKFVDLFTGTTTVAQYFKKLGYKVIANDNLEFCYALAKAYIELNNYPKFRNLCSLLKDCNGEEAHEKVINYLNNLPPKRGFIYKNYCPGSTNKLRSFFTDENGQKIDAVRAKIQEWREDKLIMELEYYYLLTALLEAINLVSNVAGTYAACLKDWDRRALKGLSLVPPKVIFSDKKNKAYKQDANELVKKISADVVYLDPPYNARQYVTNYFLLELIAEGWFNSKPVVKGKTGLFFDEDKKSLYSKKTTAYKVFSELIDNIKSRYILLSYNNEGILAENQITKELSKRGEIKSIETNNHKRYKSINQNENDPKFVREKMYLVQTNGVKERFNRLDGAKWLQHSFSIWRDVKKNKEEWQLRHPAMFPISLVEKIIDAYVDKKNRVVFDPFVGSGSTIIGALKRDMRAIGIDLSKNYIEMTKKRLAGHYKDLNKSNKYWLYDDDAINLDKYIKPNAVDLCITSPPYWNILTERRSADNKKIRNYGNAKEDLGIISEYEDFLDTLQAVFGKVFAVVRPRMFCAVIVMDIRKKSNFYPFHSDLVSRLGSVGFRLRDIIIWDRQSEYNNLRPLGYPYSFIVNKVHEYILIFEKP